MEQKMLQKYIELRRNWEENDGNADSVLALYQFMDELEQKNDITSQDILVSLYELLGLMESAYNLFLTIVNKSDRKQLKKLAQLQSTQESHGNRYALPCPISEKEQDKQKERLAHLPQFRYYPDPLGTSAFEEGEAKICPCCGKKSTIYYSAMPYCIENVEHLCPVCITNGKAAEKYDASFVQDAEWQGEPDKEKNNELFKRTPGYISWQGEHWLSCCGDYCAYISTVGTRELKAMDIAAEVLSEYEARGEFADVEKYLTKDGSLCGYLFRCLHCKKYHLWVDAD